MRRRLGIFLIASILGGLLALMLACASEPTPEPTATLVPTPEGPSVEELKSAVVSHYADGVHTLYSKSLASARAMDVAIDTFIADPGAATLEGAKRAWLIAREDYGTTEAFPF